MQPLDSLTAEFLRYAHDSAETYSDTLVGELTHVLRTQGIDTVLYFRAGCSGCDILVEKGQQSCFCNTGEESSYLLWRNEGQTFSKKLDCCRNYAVVKAPAESFGFYYRNKTVFAKGKQFWVDFEIYNKAHSDKPRFLSRGPIHDLDVSEMWLCSSNSQYKTTVWGGTYDSLGNPLFMKYEWRKKEWQWAKLLDSLTSNLYRP